MFLLEKACFCSCVKNMLFVCVCVHVCICVCELLWSYTTQRSLMNNSEAEIISSEDFCESQVG